MGIGLESAMGILVLNNTVYVDYQNAIEYRFAETYGVDIINNLTNHPITSRDGGQAMLGNNVTNAQPDWFVDVEAGDLHLASPVPALIDQGSNVANVDDDIDKTSRPQGAGFDIGADELIATGVIDYFLPTDITVFPNPGDGHFIIKFDQPLVGLIEIYSATGENILVTEVKDALFQKTINISSHPDGLYFIRVLASTKIYLTKLIVNRKS